MNKLLLVLCSACLVAACGERPQELGGAKQDKAPYTGTGVGAFTASDWKPGDKTSWEQKLKARAQYGMNDHSRAN